jgi:hypothetical protein
MYSHGNTKYGQVINFLGHQKPHPHERKSTIPKPEQNQCHDMSLNVTKCKPDIRNEDIRNEDIRNDTDKPSCQRNKFSDEDMNLASNMKSAIENIGVRVKANMEAWANTIRLMREIDNIALGEIESIFDWANGDDFWRTNILSPGKLRKQFQQLKLKKNSQPSSSYEEKTNGEPATGTSIGVFPGVK